jgi:arylsulfatase A-like enzyme
LRYPQLPRKGEATDALVSQIDLFPTLCDLLDIPTPKHARGVSLKSLAEKKAQQVRREVFAEVNYHAAYEPMRCIRTERYKLIQFYDVHDSLVLANIDESLSKTFLLDHGLRDKHREKTYLFDLYHDPMERENVVEDSAYAEILQDLQARLHAWMVETNDPLLIYKTRIPKPSKAVVNKLSCENPRIEDFEE